MKYLFILLSIFPVSLPIVNAQNHFYKQFLGKINNKPVRVLLIKAPSKGNSEFNLRGNYYYQSEGKTIYLSNGNLSETGNFYLEEGFFEKDAFTGDSDEQNVFIKTGALSGSYSPRTGEIKGNFKSKNDKQASVFYFKEDYSNGSIAADIIFNDLNYEDSQIRFHYPSFKNHPMAQKINQFVKDSLLGDMNKQMNIFINQYQESKSLGGIVDVFESSNICYIIHNDDNILSLEYGIKNYTGGAHGFYASSFFNFSLKTGNRIKLAELFIATAGKELNQIAEQTLRKNFGIKSNQSLAEFGFTLPNNRFHLSNNYYLKKEGIGFFYNLYEIAPYAVGTQDIFIPFERIKHLIKKEGLLGKYVK